MTVPLSPRDFALQHSDVAQPTLLDEELADFDWPLPAPNPYAPKLGFWARVRGFLRDLRDPFDVEL